MTARLNCELCNFAETCSETQYFAHLKIHIHNKETVKCLFKDCSFKSSVYSTFRAHKSKKHHFCTVDMHDLLQHKVASLLLRLQTNLHVSKTTTQEIINELCSIGSIVEECTPKIIESVLHNCAVNSAVTAAITEIVKKVK